MRNLIPRAAALAGAGTLLAGLAVALTAPPASASTEVTCPHDNLQAAINAAAPGATIEVSGTCTGHFTITKDLTIQGQPATTLDGGGTGIVVTVDQGATAVLDTLTIQHGDGFIGGGIFNGGAVTLEDSTVSGNTATLSHGGGIYNTGAVTLKDSTVSGNTARFAGGIANQGTVTLTDSTVSGNKPDNCFPPGSVPGCTG